MHKFNLLLLLFALSAVTFVGCDSNDDEDGGSSDVLGRWVDTDGNEYLNISNEEIVVHLFEEDEPDVEDCFERIEVDVLDIDGDEWTVRNDDGDETITQAIRLQRDGDDLVITFDIGENEDLERYQRSTRMDFTPLCVD